MNHGCRLTRRSAKAVMDFHWGHPTAGVPKDLLAAATARLWKHPA